MMKAFKLALCAVVLLTGCTQTQSPNAGTTSTEAAKDSAQPPVVASNTTQPCQLANPDTSVFGILLEDSASVAKQVGKVLVLKDLDEALPAQYTVFSEDEKQKLTLIFHPGNITNRFSEFMVGPVPAGEQRPTVKTKIFVTNSGIQLGLSKAQVIAILGACYQASAPDRDTDILRYHIDDFANSAFLKRYNMPIYYAEYTFEKDVLTAFKFGFENP